MNETLDIKIRKAVPSDLDFITSTWLNSAYEVQRREFKKDIFMQNHNRMIKERMPLLKCLVACNPENEDQIFGYIIFNRPDILHYGYTKSMYRRLKVFSKLVQASEIQVPLQVTHKAPMYKALEGQYSFIFNPYLFIEVRNEAVKS